MASPSSPSENIEDEVYDRTCGEDGVLLIQSRALVAAPTCPEDEDDFVTPSERKTPVKPPSSKRLKAASNDDEEDGRMDEDDKTPSKAAGRGRGGRGAGATPEERGRGLGGRGFMNFGERKDPPHKGEKEVPDGAPDCLAGLTFVISGTLDSLEREEAVDLIKRYGGRVTSAISKNTSYLLADEDLGGVKSNKAKYLGVPFLTEDHLFDMIWKSKPAAILEPLDESLPEEYGVASAEGDEEEVPEGAPYCLAGLTFVISGTLDSLEREEAVDLIKRYGGRVMRAISKNTSYLLADEDIGGVKSNKAKDLGVPFLTEDDLFDMIWKSNPAKAPVNKHEDGNGSEKGQSHESAN